MKGIGNAAVILRPLYVQHFAHRVVSWPLNTRALMDANPAALVPNFRHAEAGQSGFLNLNPDDYR